MRCYKDNFNYKYYLIRTKKDYYLIQEYLTYDKEIGHIVEVKGFNNVCAFIRNNRLEEIESGGKVKFNFTKSYKNRDYTNESGERKL